MSPETETNIVEERRRYYDKDNQNWIQYYWRPIMAWQYTFICLFDFVIAPILSAFFAYFTGMPYIPWTPLTLGEGGFYHMSMGAIIGVTAWTRGQEKVQKIINGYDDEDYDYSSRYRKNTRVDAQVPVDRPLMRPRR